MQWTTQAPILDLPTPMYGPCHVTAKRIATEESFFSSHDKNHLCSNSLTLDLIHLQFRCFANSLPFGLAIVHGTHLLSELINECSNSYLICFIF